MPKTLTESDKTMRKQLVTMLRGRGAHADTLSAVEDLPPELQGDRPQGGPYSPWEILEHIRLTQADILDYMTNPDYVEQNWPQDYWPRSTKPPTSDAWRESVQLIRADLEKVIAIVSNPDVDLFAQIPHGEEGHTLFREALLVADHNAYHTGQMVLIRKLLGAWGIRKE